MNINDLSAKYLNQILQELSLDERIHLRGVCTHWFHIIEEMCHQIQSLTLLGSEKNVTDYSLTLLNDNSLESKVLKLKPIGKDNDLVIEGINPQICETFAQLFPNLQSLTIHISWDCQFETLRLWLLRFPALQSLTICGSIEEQDERFLQRFLPTLNSLENLTTLNLMVTNFFVLSNGEASPIELPQVMSQLAQFSITNYSGNLDHLLRQLNSAKCKRLRMDVVRNENNVTALSQAIVLNRELMNNLTHLRLSLPKMNQTNQLIPVICQNLKKLQYLDIQSCAVMNFEMLKIDSNFITEINCLTCLTELRLSHVGVDLLEFDFQIYQIAHLKVLHLSQVNIYPTDKTAGLSLYIETNIDEILWRSLSFLFPKLEQLFVRVKRSSIAKISEHVKEYFGQLQKSRIYSVEDELDSYFGRHPSYESGEEQEFFSEYVFNKIKNF